MADPFVWGLAGLPEAVAALLYLSTATLLLVRPWEGWSPALDPAPWATRSFAAYLGLSGLSAFYAFNLLAGFSQQPGGVLDWWSRWGTAASVASTVAAVGVGLACWRPRTGRTAFIALATAGVVAGAVAALVPGGRVVLLMLLRGLPVLPLVAWLVAWRAIGREHVGLGLVAGALVLGTALSLGAQASLQVRGLLGPGVVALSLVPQALALVGASVHLAWAGALPGTPARAVAVRWFVVVGAGLVAGSLLAAWPGPGPLGRVSLGVLVRGGLALAVCTLGAYGLVAEPDRQP